jgi:hypothetical protein
MFHLNNAKFIKSIPSSQETLLLHDQPITGIKEHVPPGSKNKPSK